MRASVLVPCHTIGTTGRIDGKGPRRAQHNLGNCLPDHELPTGKEWLPDEHAERKTNE